MTDLRRQHAGDLAHLVSYRVMELLHFTWNTIIEPAYMARSQPKTWEKEGGEPVSVIDVHAEEFIQTGLRTLLPEAAFLGEETQPRECPERGLCWVVDPLDGTGNFIRRDPNFALIVALLCDGVPVGGWMSAPLKQTALWAIKGEGAFINGTPIHLGSHPVGMRYRVAVAPRLEGTQRNVSREPLATIARVPSSAAIQYLELGLGRLDAAIFDRARPWDHMAGVLFISEAGGCCMRPRGSEYRLGDDGYGLITARDPLLLKIAASKLYCPRDHHQESKQWIQRLRSKV